MALNFPNSPTAGQVFDQWTWNGNFWELTPIPPTVFGVVTYYQEATPSTAGVNGETWYQPSTNTLSVLEAGVWTPVTSPSTGGFTFVSDTAPTPTKAGDSWFDTSDGASGGTSWVAISEVPGSAGPLNWVQFAPGSGADLTTQMMLNQRFVKAIGNGSTTSNSYVDLATTPSMVTPFTKLMADSLVVVTFAVGFYTSAVMGFTFGVRIDSTDYTLMAAFSNVAQQHDSRTIEVPISGIAAGVHTFTPRVLVALGTLYYNFDDPISMSIREVRRS